MFKTFLAAVAVTAANAALVWTATPSQAVQDEW